MKRLKGKVAVITGAANGLGHALAERAAREGMKVVVADIDKKGLAQVEKALAASGATVLARLTDVSNLEDVQALVKQTIDKFGAVHLVCNAAGVHCLKPLAQTTLDDWKWVAGVDLYGPIYTLALLVPIMMKQDTECHIVNVAPVYGGFYPLPFNGPYNVSAFGLVTLSEVLYIEMADKHPKIGVTLFAPEYADPAILESERYRPDRFKDAGEKTAGEDVPHLNEIQDLIAATSQTEMPVEKQAELVFDAIRANKFYIFPHPSSKVLIHERLAHIDNQSNPMNILQLMGIAG